MPDFNDYRLSKWRRLLIIREARTITLPGNQGTARVAYCPMCNTDMPVWRLQAHHIRPKSLHPHLAYDLDNGICLCLSCHMGIVHGGNSFRDLSEVGQWEFFVPSFDRYVDLAKNRRFNEANQSKI